MRGVLLYTAIVLTNCCISRGQDQTPDSSSIALSTGAEILKQHRDSLAILKNVQYRARIATSLPGNSALKGYTTEVTYFGKTRYYKWRVVTDAPTESRFRDYSVAFDGTQFARLTGDYLELAKTEREGDPHTYRRGALFLPYEFLVTLPKSAAFSAIQTRADYRSATLHDVIGAQSWDRFLAVAHFSTVAASNGEEYVIASSKCGRDPAFGNEDTGGTISVSFARHSHGFPVKWTRENGLGDRLEYQVTELGSVRLGESALKFSYPKKATLRKFFAGKSDATIIDELVIDKLNVNDDQFSEDMLTIDPAMATLINDVDAKTIIAVPK